MINDNALNLRSYVTVTGTVVRYWEGEGGHRLRIDHYHGEVVVPERCQGLAQLFAW
jgi:hypothetical protein